MKASLLIGTRRAILVVLTANALFLALNIIGLALPREPVVERIRTAFRTRDLVHEDWRYMDSRRGFSQWMDCAILLLAIDRGAGPLERSIGPVLTLRDRTYRDICTSLDEVAHASARGADYFQEPYTRYWHGYLPVTSAALQVLHLRTYRRALRWGVYASLILLLLAAGFGHLGLFAVAACVALVGTLFWAAPYYAPSPAHGIGDAFGMIGLAVLLRWRASLLDLRTLLPFCAAFGAGVAYFEFLTGQLPVAAGFLFVFIYLIGRTLGGADQDTRRSFALAAAGLVAFGVGAFLTVMIKQLLVLIFFGRAGSESFAYNLRLWAGLPLPEGPHPWTTSRLRQPIAALFRGGFILTRGSQTLATALLLGTIGTWLGAALLAIRRSGTGPRYDLLAFLVGAAAIPAWVFLLPAHTTTHAAFMVRMLIVPISLGWGALLWQIHSSWTAATRGGRTVDRTD